VYIPKLPSEREYTVYASVFHISPPEKGVKANHVLVYDTRGRLIASLGGGTVGPYGARYSKKAARVAVAGFVNSFGVSDVGDEDVHRVTEEEGISHSQL